MPCSVCRPLVVVDYFFDQKFGRILNVDVVLCRDEKPAWKQNLMKQGFYSNTSWAPRRCPGLFHNFIVKKSRADWSKDPAGFGMGWAPHKKNLYNQTHPEEQPPPNSQSIHPHLVGWTLRAPGLGVPPTNKILHGKPTPRSNFCLLASAQFFTLQGFSDGVTIGGTPRGQHLGSPPGSGLSQGEMRSPCQISKWLVV